VNALSKPQSCEKTHLQTKGHQGNLLRVEHQLSSSNKGAGNTREEMTRFLASASVEFPDIAAASAWMEKEIFKAQEALPQRRLCQFRAASKCLHSRHAVFWVLRWMSGSPFSETH